MNRTLVALALVGLAGCAATQTPAEYQASLAQSCKDAGFTENTESFRLCTLLQDNNARLEALDRRIRFIEQDTRFVGRRGYGYWP